MQHFLSLGAAAVALCLPMAASAQFALYDDFESNQLRPSRWSLGTTERRLESVGGTLRMLQKDWGTTDASTGTDSRSHNASLSNGARVTQLRASIKVTDFDAVGCTVPGSASSVGRARMVGVFFNSGNRVNGSNLGDVLAQVWLSRASNASEPTGLFRVEGSVFMCTDSSCNTATQIGTTQSLGTVALGTAAVVSMEWDRTGKRFVFTRDSGAYSAQVPYLQGDSAFPGAPFMSIGTRTSVARCTATPRPKVLVDARFDAVAVNDTAVQ